MIQLSDVFKSLIHIKLGHMDVRKSNNTNKVNFFTTQTQVYATIPLIYHSWTLNQRPAASDRCYGNTTSIVKFRRFTFMFSIESSLWITMADCLVRGVTPAWYKVLPQSYCMQLMLVILHLCENDCLSDVECLTVANFHFHTSHACSRWLPFSLFPLALSLFLSLSMALSFSV